MEITFNHNFHVCIHKADPFLSLFTVICNINSYEQLITPNIISVKTNKREPTKKKHQPKNGKLNIAAKLITSGIQLFILLFVYVTYNLSYLISFYVSRIIQNEWDGHIIIDRYTRYDRNTLMLVLYTK